MELAQGISGPLAARYLADFGADVVKIEPAGGDVSRHWGPFPSGNESPETSGYFLNLNRNKQSVVLDFATAAGQAALDRLLTGWATAVVVDDSFLNQPGCAPERMLALNPALAICAVTPYGLTGPLAGAPGTDLTALAAGGILWMTGDPDRPPVQIAGQQALHLSGIVAASHVMLTVLFAEATGIGQIVDVSHQESVASVLEQAIPEFLYANNVVFRNGNRHPVAHGMGRPQLADGTYVFAGNLPESHMWDALVEFLKLDEFRGAHFRDLLKRLPHADAIDAAVQSAIGGMTVDEVFAPLQARGVPITPIATAADVRHSPQLTAREFFVTVEEPTGTVELLGPAVRLTATPGRIVRPAPRLGEHTVAWVKTGTG